MTGTQLYTESYYSRLKLRALCLHCDSEYIKKTRNQKFCKNRCRQRNKEGIRTPKQIGVLRESPCTSCSRPFVKRGIRGTSKQCLNCIKVRRAIVRQQRRMSIKLICKYCQKGFLHRGKVRQCHPGFCTKMYRSNAWKRESLDKRRKAQWRHKYQIKDDNDPLLILLEARYHSGLPYAGRGTASSLVRADAL